MWNTLLFVFIIFVSIYFSSIIIYKGLLKAIQDELDVSEELLTAVSGEPLGILQIKQRYDLKKIIEVLKTKQSQTTQMVQHAILVSRIANLNRFSRLYIRHRHFHIYIHIPILHNIELKGGPRNLK